MGSSISKFLKFYFIRALFFGVNGLVACKHSKPSKPFVSVFSLQYTPDEKFSKPVRDVWKWKDSILGDGRDFFVPKPKTIMNLQQILINHVDGLQECSILSNCARFEVLCVWEAPSSTDHQSRIQDISRIILQQVDYYFKAKNQLIFSMTKSLDRPGLLLSDEIENQVDTDMVVVQELSRHWDRYDDLSEILFHVCEISAGMATRPRRPFRPVIFRPFSSRDAHILLQLKRTKDVVSSSSGTLNRVLECALRAGKAARNPLKATSLKLLEGYGDGSSKYSSSDPPLELSNQVKEDVLIQVIDPLIEEYLSKITNEGRNYAIQTFRQAAMDMAKNSSELRFVKQRMHQPTIACRNAPNSFIVEDVLAEIQEELREFRQDY